MNLNTTPSTEEHRLEAQCLADRLNVLIVELGNIEYEMGRDIKRHMPAADHAVTKLRLDLCHAQLHEAHMTLVNESIEGVAK